MYLVTDIQAIQAAAASIAPPVPASEALLALYPGATIDAQGRAHAPCEGYTVEGIAYHAGEYLPLPENATGRGIAKTWVVEAVDAEPVELSGPRDVLAAVREEAKRQERTADTARGFVGKVGEKVDLTLTLFSVFSTPGEYGWRHAHVFRTDGGERVLYAGPALLARVRERVRVSAKVVDHYTGMDGRRSTILRRPKVVKGGAQ